MASKKDAYIDVDGIPLEAGGSRSELDKQTAVDERKRTRGVVMQQALAHAQYAKRLSIYRTVSDTLANAKIVKATCESIATEITPARGYRAKASLLIEQLAEAVDKLTELQKAADTIIASTPALIVDHVCKDCKQLAEEVDKLYGCVNKVRLQAEKYEATQKKSEERYRNSEKGRQNDERHRENVNKRYHTDPEYAERKREYSRMYRKKRLESMTPEQLAAYNEKERERKRKYYNKGNFKKWYEQNKEKFLAYRREYRRKKLESMTSEELAEHKAKQKEGQRRYHDKGNFKNWYEQNKEKILAYRREYRRKKLESMSPEQVAEYKAKEKERCRRYYDRNKEKLLAYGREYRRRISEIRRQQAEVQSTPTRRDDATSQDI